LVATDGRWRRVHGELSSRLMKRHARYVSARALDMRRQMPEAIEVWKELKSAGGARFEAELQFDGAT
jgi:hypothetical protein